MLQDAMLLVHAAGYILILIGLLFNSLALIGLRLAGTTEILRFTFKFIPWVKRVMITATVFIGVSAYVMATTSKVFNWHSAWIQMAVVGYVAILILALTKIDPKMDAIHAALSRFPGEGTLTAISSSRRAEQFGWVSAGIMVAYLPLMSVQPASYIGSLAILSCGAAGGLVFDWKFPRRKSTIILTRKLSV